MIRLMKYEFRKTLVLKLIVMGVTAVAEIVFLAGLWGDLNDALIIGTVLLTLLAFGGVMAIGLGSVVILHRDMNTRQSYMLFMTPNSCYKILGAKVLENGISILMAGAFYFALGALDITLLFAHEGRLADLWKMITDFLTQIDSRITLDTTVMLALTARLLTGWISMIVAAYLGDVISTALLNGKRYNGLVSFIAFVAINWLVNWIQIKATATLNPVTTVFLVASLIALVLSAGMYFVTARIMDRKLSV